ncbi:MAG: hypothetical protein IKJ01_09130 [Lachnospiraceae bacterium]|nr:hypothetical protein [Lachnospiraceae bacterium]
MSSYITSPFVLEERRLQGIVNQCTQDFNIALQNVRQQQDFINQKAKMQNRKDQQYFVSNEISEKEYKTGILERHVELQEKRQYLQEMLQSMKIELDIFQREYSEMDNAIKRQAQLEFRLENSLENLEQLEVDIGFHIKTTEAEIQQLSEEKYRKFVYEYKLDNIVNKKAKKGISLQVHKQENLQNTVYDAPFDIFVAKLAQVLDSPYHNRFPSIRKLKEAFDLQPEYAKPAFAVKHMQKLDELLKQLQAISNTEKMADNKRQKIVLQYRAICNLMHIEADERMIEDERSTRKLIQLYQELFRNYQEQKKQEYISSAISNVMQKRGIVFQDSINSDYGNVMQFGLDNATIQISGTEHNYLELEVAGQYFGELPTLNERRKSVSSMEHFCSLFRQIEIELKEDYGIIFQNILTEVPNEDAIQMRKISNQEGKKYFGKNQVANSL